MNDSLFDSEMDYQIKGYYPQSFFMGTSFAEEINNLSPSFVKIFNQALHAENESLDLTCGVGFRKSAEYLIKDYTVSVTIGDEEKIKAIPLQQCISKYINHATIKEMARRAVSLGNDETHIVRK